MYPFSFLVIAIISVVTFASNDALVIGKRDSDGHVVDNFTSTGKAPTVNWVSRSSKGGGLLVNIDREVHVRRNNHNVKLRRNGSSYNNKSSLIGDLTPNILELYGGVLDIMGPIAVDIPVVKDTPLVQSTFPKVASTVPGVIVDFGKTLDKTLNF